MAWLIGVRIVVLLLALRRLGGDAAGVARKQLPATRLALPVLLVMAALLVANHLVPRAVTIAALLAVDVLFLIACFVIAASLRASALHLHYREDRLQHAFERFFPPAFARVFALELTVYSHVAAGAKGFVSPPKPSYASYVAGSKIIMLAIILTLSIVPDAFLLWLLLPHHLWWLALVLDALEIWSCGWLFGIYGTMIARPHEIGEESAVFHNGVLKRVRVDCADVLTARALGSVKRRALPRKRGDGSVVLALGGVPIVEIELRSGKKLFVASDAPDALVQRLASVSS